MLPTLFRIIDSSDYARTWLKWDKTSSCIHSAGYSSSGLQLGEKGANCIFGFWMVAEPKILK